MSAPGWLEARLIAPESSGDVGCPVALAGSWCTQCDRAEFPERATCPVCGNEAEPLSLSATGLVVGVTAVMHQPPGSLLQAPYGVVAVTHDEGITILGPLVDIEWADVAVGDGVECVAIAVGDRLGFGYRPFGEAQNVRHEG